MLTGTAYYLLKQCYRQVFGEISQMPHTILYFILDHPHVFHITFWSNVYRYFKQIFGYRIHYFILDQCSQVLHTKFWSNFYSYWLTACKSFHRYRIHYTCTAFWTIAHRYYVYYLVEQYLQVLRTNLWSNFTDTAYTTSFWTTALRYCILQYLMEQRLQVLHTDLRSNLTDAVNTNFFWTTAHSILPFRAQPGTAYAFWSKTHTYSILSYLPLLKDTA